MNQVVPTHGFNLPAAAVQRMQTKSIAKNMVDGVGAAIDILSIKGKNFTERVDGEFVQTPRPQYEFDVVILDATPNLGKTYYINQFEEGTMAPPDCWSLNGVKPDAGAPAKQSTTCRGCPKNVFGSRINDRPGQPSKGKACADSRRVAVFAAYKLGYDVPPLMLRVPATSLKALKEYAMNLERNNVPVNGIVTRLGFEAGVAHPQLNFTAHRALTDAEFQWIDYFQRADEQGNYLDERLVAILDAPMQEEDIDPSELAGNQITNRLQAPAAVAQPVAPLPPQATPPQPTAQQTYAPPPPVQQARPTGHPTGHPTAPYVDHHQEVIIPLPDGRVFNQTKGVFVETRAEPPRPASVIDLPDGKAFDTATGQYWGVNVAPAAPAAPTPPVPLSVQAAPKPPATPPSTAKVIPMPPHATPGVVPGPDWKPAQDIPDFVPKHLHGSAAPASVPMGAPPQPIQQAQPAQAEAAAAAKPRKPRSTPPAAGGQEVQEAPKALEDLLSSLS